MWSLGGLNIYISSPELRYDGRVGADPGPVLGDPDPCAGRPNHPLHLPAPHPATLRHFVQ